MLLHYQAEEENLLLLLTLQHEEKRTQVNDMFRVRKVEGFQTLLIENHLKDNETKFKEFFRVSRHQFNYVLELIKGDLSMRPYNRVKDPLKPEEKLAVTLR